MRYKIMMLAILLVSLLAISAVSAADNATDNIVGVGETTDVAISVDEADEVVSVEDNQEIIGNESDGGTFDELSSLIENTTEGTTLELDKDYKYVSGSTAGIFIGKSVTIDGNNHVIDGNQLSRIFYVSSDDVVLKNLKIVNGKTFLTAGAILWSGTNGNIVNCTFYNCQCNPESEDSYVVYGGAIYCSYNGNLSIIDCIFKDNSANHAKKLYSGGGAIYLETVACTIINCTFENNFARWGGAIDNYHTKLMNIINCTFIKNKASQTAGAIILSASNNNLTGCLFENNTSEFEGGAIYVQEGINYINYCNFTNNFAQSSGGAISLIGSYNDLISNCIFINNSARPSEEYGFGNSIMSIESEDCLIIYCYFYPELHNIDIADLKGVDVIKTKTIISFDDLLFEYGVESNLSALLKNVKNISLNNQNIIFKFNDLTVNGVTDDNGIAVISSELFNFGAGTWNVTAIFEGNDNYDSCNSTATITVLPLGTSLTIDDVNTTWDQETTFTAQVMADNKTVDEGTVSFYIDDKFIGDASVVNGTATLTHEAPGDAGNHVLSAIYNGINYLSSNRTAKMFVDTGDIEVEDYDSIATFKSLQNLIDNALEGAVLNLTKDYIYVSGSNEGIHINKAITIDGHGHALDGNYASRILTINNQNIVLKNLRIINGYFKNSGGAIYCYMSGNIVVGDIINCSFINNSVKRDGGACYFAYSSFNIDNCTFINNSAGWDNGGAIYIVLDDGESGNIINSGFFNNSGNIEGWGNFKSISKCIFDKPLAISWHNADYGIIDNCIFLSYLNNINLDSCSNIVIIKNKINLSCEDLSFNFNEPVNYSIKLNGAKLLSGNKIHFVLMNGEQYIEIDSYSDDYGIVSFSNEIRGLNKGIWNVTTIFEGNDNYYPCNATATITVLPASSSLTIDDVNTTVGHEVTLVANVNSTLAVNEGIVSFFDGETNIGDANVVGGVATLTYTPSVAGEHTITASFNSDNYGSSNDTALLTVSKADVELSIDYIADVYFTNPSNFAVNVNSNFKPVNEGKVKYYVNNELVGTVDVYEGNANFNYVTGTAGSFTLTAAYEETDNYFAKNASATFNVNKMPTTLSGESIIFDEEAYKTFTTELKDNNNNGVGGQPVKIEVIKYSGESATFNGVSDANGITIYDVGRLAGGMWYVTGIYAGNNNYINSRFVDKFIVVRMNTTTEIEEIDNPKVNHNYKLKANIHDENGKLVKEGIVQFYLDGVDIGSIDLSKNQGHQDALGEGVLGAVNPMFEFVVGADDVSDLYINYVPTKAGKHTLTAVYEGTTIYKASNSTTSFDVSNSNTLETSITVSDVSTVYNGGKYIVIQLKDVNGKAVNGVKVTVVLGGKTFTPTTKNGQAKVSTNGLAPVKTYKATITFKGNSKYDKSTTTANVVVKKATPKLTAKAKTFKKSVKTKKYTVTLKTNQNKVMKNTKVSLKVNGKTYSAITNAKGQATFKITKLTKKGKFTAVVKFAGNKYYNAKTVKPKITVK